MAIAVRGTPQKKQGSGAATIQTDTGYTTATGDLLIVAINDPVASIAITDNYGNNAGFTRVGSRQVIDSTGVNLWYCENATGGTNHRVLATATGGTMDAALFFFAISGAATASFDKTAQGNDTVSPYTITSPTLSQANEIVVVMTGNAGSPVSFTEGNGFTKQLEETNDALYWTAAIATKVVASTSAVTSSWTLGADTTQAMILATFKESGGGSSVAPRAMAHYRRRRSA